MILDLNSGDFCLSHSDKALAKIITGDESLKVACDPYWNHSFFITDSRGATFDTVFPKVRQGNLYEDYQGQYVRIARWAGMNDIAFQFGFDLVRGKLGQLYPWWKLLLIAAGIARLLPVKSPDVCSENEAEMLFGATGMAEFSNPNAWTPGHLAVVFKRWQGFSILFEGVLK